MSNQESHNQGDTKETVVKKRRQFIKGAGIAAPVILTLSSPSVFGNTPGQCLSQILSGNQSHAVTPNCTLGHTPLWWSNFSSANLSIIQPAWNATPYLYGTKGIAASCSGYTNGTKFSSAFTVNPTTAVSPTTLANTTMLAIICSSTTNATLDAYLVAALLNASTPGSGYLLTPTQVIGMKTGTPAFSVPPGYADLLAFLKATMLTSPN